MSFLKNRKSGNEVVLDLKEGISNEMKNIKHNAFGIGSHRALEVNKLGLQQKVGTAAAAMVVKEKEVKPKVMEFC